MPQGPLRRYRADTVTRCLSVAVVLAFAAVIVTTLLITSKHLHQADLVHSAPFLYKGDKLYTFPILALGQGAAAFLLFTIALVTAVYAVVRAFWLGIINLARR